MVNRDMPRTVDRDSRVDSVVVGPGRIFTYMMTLVNHRATDIEWIEFERTVGVSIRNGVCSAEFMRVFIRNNVKIVYRYRANDGRIIGDITVLPSDCA